MVRKVNSQRVPFIKQKPANNPRSQSGRWAAKVVAKPVRFGLVAALLLGVLAAPVFAMRLGFAGPGNDGPATTTRKAYERRRLDRTRITSAPGAAQVSPPISIW